MQLYPGDRILVKNLEFKDWIATEATVTQVGIRFPHAEPSIRQHTIKIRLDKHPFPNVIGSPMKELSFYRDDPNYICERL